MGNLNLNLNSSYYKTSRTILLCELIGTFVIIVVGVRQLIGVNEMRR